MKKQILFLALLFGWNTAITQCVEDEETTVLLIGDSWAFFMDADETFNHVMNHWGHTNQRFYSNITLAVNGATAEDFLEPARLNEIENQLTTKPNLKTVHLSIGGNDFLGEWNIEFTPEEFEELSDETFDEVTAIIDFIHDIRPDIQIVFSGYMYANFAEIIADAVPFEESHPFYEMWADMGFPDFEEINTTLNLFSERMVEYAELNDHVDFIFAPAYMQYVYGQEEPLGALPGGTYPPYFQPLPYGDITYPSPKLSMRDYGLFRDCFHLSAEGYWQMMDYQFEMGYQKLLMDDYYVLADGENCGSVNASGTTSTHLKIGEEDGEAVATVLSFNINDLPDTAIESMNLFLRIEDHEGMLSLENNFTLTMDLSYLGTEVGIDADDYDDEGSISMEICGFASDLDSSNWIRFDIPDEFVDFINATETLQFSVKANESTGDLLVFSDASNPKFAPLFNVNYTPADAAVSTIVRENNGIVLYPNPTVDILNIKTLEEPVQYYSIINTAGEIVREGPIYDDFINVSSLAPTVYIIQLIGDDFITNQTFIKK